MLPRGNTRTGTDHVLPPLTSQSAPHRQSSDQIVRAVIGHLGCSTMRTREVGAVQCRRSRVSIDPLQKDLGASLVARGVSAPSVLIPPEIFGSTAPERPLEISYERSRSATRSSRLANGLSSIHFRAPRSSKSSTTTSGRLLILAMSDGKPINCRWRRRASRIHVRSAPKTSPPSRSIA